VVAAVLVVIGVGLTIGRRGSCCSTAPRIRPQTRRPAVPGVKATYGQAMQSDDPAARDEAWTQLPTVGPWRASEDLRQLADNTFLTALAMLLSALIAVSLAVLNWRRRRRPGVRFDNA